MQPDPWAFLRLRTTARVAMGRAGGSLPTCHSLAFAADHADARDAVFSELNTPLLTQQLQQPVVLLSTRAIDRMTYLQRPDLGRQLDNASCVLLDSLPVDETDVALIVADGLSAVAVQRHSADLVRQLQKLVIESGFSLAPLCIVRQARVAVADQIGFKLRSQLVVILIGERPGLSLSDSMSAYLTFAAGTNTTDADRNCVSNIHPKSLPPAAAAQTIFWLIRESLRQQISGIALKDESPILPAVLQSEHSLNLKGFSTKHSDE